MRFYVTDCSGVYPGFLEGLSDNLGLRLWIGNREAIGLATMINSRCLNHPVDMIPISLCFC